MECPKCGGTVVMKQKSEIESEWNLSEEGKIKEQRGQATYIGSLETHGECLECGEVFNFNPATNKVELESGKNDEDS